MTAKLIAAVVKTLTPDNLGTPNLTKKDVRDTINKVNGKGSVSVVYVSTSSLNAAVNTTDSEFPTASPAQVIHHLFRGNSSIQVTEYIYIISPELLESDIQTAIFLYRNLRNVIMPRNLTKGISTVFDKDTAIARSVNTGDGESVTVEAGCLLYRLVDSTADRHVMSRDGIPHITPAMLFYLSPRIKTLGNIRVINGNDCRVNSVVPRINVSVRDKKLILEYNEYVRGTRWHTPRSKITLTPPPAVTNIDNVTPVPVEPTVYEEIDSRPWPEGAVLYPPMDNSNPSDYRRTSRYSNPGYGHRTHTPPPSRVAPFTFRNPLMASLYPTPMDSKVIRIPNGMTPAVLPLVMELIDPIRETPVSTMVVLAPVHMTTVLATLSRTEDPTVLITTKANIDTVKSQGIYGDSPFNPDGHYVIVLG